MYFLALIMVTSLLGMFASLIALVVNPNPEALVIFVFCTVSGYMAAELLQDE